MVAFYWHMLGKKNFKIKKIDKETWYGTVIAMWLFENK